ncbi:MAG: CHASE2 domain-containing protein [Deltaproteobacteria bacterium]|nr:CHASE2 domain-containing protein [Deltaproteobacteria bacterium]
MEKTRIGKEAIDLGFDFLVTDNYKYSVIKGQSKEPISPDFNLIFFDENTYVNSYTKGFWTPRELLGLTIVNAIKRNAKVVLVDFNFSGQSPVVVDNGQTIDDTSRYLAYLQTAAELARKNNASIVVPLPSGARSPKGYIEILSRYRDVFKAANFSGLRDSSSGLVRRFAWYSYNADYAPVLSANLLSYLLLRHDRDSAALKEAEAAVVGAESPASELSPELIDALRPENNSISTRIIFRILPREMVRRNYGTGPDLLRGVMWLPGQVNGPNMAEPDFGGKAVLIGSDYRDNGDYHDTAFGMMSGSFILANSVNTILTGSMAERPKLVNLALLIGIGLFACYAFAYIERFIPTTIFLAFAFLTPSLSAFFFNRYGIFLDVWIPVLAVNLVNFLVDRSALALTVATRVKTVGRLIPLIRSRPR